MRSQTCSKKFGWSFHLFFDDCIYISITYGAFQFVSLCCMGEIGS